MNTPDIGPLYLESVPGITYLLPRIKPLADLHDQQGRAGAVLTLSAAQAKRLAAHLETQIYARELYWNGHRVRIAGADTAF
jgi:hypothetical protein